MLQGSQADMASLTGGPAPGLRLRSKEFVLASVAAIAAACVYLLIVYAHGALGVSRNDDWVYYRAISLFHQNGFFKPDPFTDAMLIGQLVAFRPLFAAVGQNIAAFQIATCAVGAVGLVTAYAFLRRFLSVAPAAMSIGVLALGPIFGVVSTTFMTDIPSFAVQALCLLLGARALEGREPDTGRLVVALAVGLVAFSFREYGAATSLAILAVALVRTFKASWRARLTVVALGAIWLAFAVVLFVWRKSLSADAGRPMAIDFLPNSTDAVQVARLWFTLSLLIAPALAFVRPKTVLAAWSRHRIVASMAALVVGGAWIPLCWRHSVLLGNYVLPITPYSIVFRGLSPTVIPTPLWFVVEIVSGVSAICLAVLAVYGLGLVIRRFPLDRMTRGANRSAASLALVYTGLSVGVLAAANVLGAAPLFDRYLITVVPLAAGWIIYAFGTRRPAPSQKIAGGVALAAYAVLSLAIQDAAATFDGARWRIAQAAVARGYPPEVVDAGYEWFGLHHPVEIAHGETVRGDGWWLTLFDDPNVCVIVSLPDKGGGYIRDGSAGPDALVASYTAHGLFGATYALQAWRVQNSCRLPAEGK